MACNVFYSCSIKRSRTLWYHNVLINEKKWNYAENANGEPLTKEEVEKLIKDVSCGDEDLKRFGFVEGWIIDCPQN